MENSQQALAQLQQAQQSAQNPQNLLAQQQQQLGVQGQRDTTTGLRGAVDKTTKLLQQVAPSVMGRTQSSLVTNAQANRQIANEQAPISQNLNSQTTAYNQSAQDLADTENRASQAAQLAYTGQQDRLSYLQNLYGSLYQREQDEANRQETIRQFNEEQARLRQAAAASSASAGFNLGGLLGGAQQAAQSTQEKSSGPRVVQSSPGSFAFYDSGGKPITAAAYASATRKDIRDVLYEMGQAGDQQAAKTYNLLRGINGTAALNNTIGQLSKALPHLFGGYVGATFGPYTSSSTPKAGTAINKPVTPTTNMLMLGGK